MTEQSDNENSVTYSFSVSQEVEMRKRDCEDHDFLRFHKQDLFFGFGTI